MRVNHKRQGKKEARGKGIKSFFYQETKERMKFIQKRKEKGNKNINLMEALGWILWNLWTGFAWDFFRD